MSLPFKPNETKFKRFRVYILHYIAVILRISFYIEDRPYGKRHY